MKFWYPEPSAATCLREGRGH